MNESIELTFCNVLSRIYTASQNEFTFEGPEDEPSPVTEDGVPIRKLFIGNLAERTTYKDLVALFSKYGTVKSCFLKRNGGRSNCAFLTFNNVQDAVSARKDGIRRQIILHNRGLRVMAADSWHQPDSIENQYHITNGKDSNKSEKKTLNEQNNEDYIQYDDINICIHKLNDDCLMHIFSYLPIVDRVRIERVCKRWRAVSQESWCTVKKLDLLYSTWGFPQHSKQSVIGTVTLRKILLRCGRFLNHIDFAQISHCLSQSTMNIVGRLCPNLQTIDITALMVSASGINSLTNNCRDITRFSLGPSTYTCDSDLIKLFKANQKLKYLKIVTNDIIGTCLFHLPSNAIEEIVLQKCHSIDGLHLSKAFAKLNNLRSLSIHQCVGVNSSVIKAISRHTDTLKELELYDAFPLINSTDMLYITQLTNLEVLKVVNNPAVTNEFLEKLVSNCLLLTYLDITGCNMISNAGVIAIATLPMLEKLVMNYLNITDEALCVMYNLKLLECRGCSYLNDKGVSMLIKQSPNLEVLDLSGCSCITNHTLNVAVISTNRRTNNTVLKIFIGGTAVIHNEFFGVSPFLQIVNVDLSLNALSDFMSAMSYEDYDSNYEDSNLVYTPNTETESL